MTNLSVLDKYFQSQVQPSQKGYINLLDEYIPLIDKCISIFNSSYDSQKYWLHLNDKLFAKVPLQDLDLINHRSVYNYLSTALSLELDPIGSSLTVSYDAKNHSITPVMHLQGYIEILNRNEDYIGCKYVEKHDFVDVKLQKRVYQRDENDLVIGYEDVAYTMQLPSTIECHIFARTKTLPEVSTVLPKYIGVVSASEIGSTRAWQEHPLQMMYDKAFTHAVSHLIKGCNVMSFFDYEDSLNESVKKEYDPKLYDSILKMPIYNPKAANESQDSKTYKAKSLRCKQDSEEEKARNAKMIENFNLDDFIM